MYKNGQKKILSDDSAYTNKEIDAIKEDIKKHVYEYGGVTTAVCLKKKNSAVNATLKICGGQDNSVAGVVMTLL